jgi:hypothetical protein
VTSDLVTDEGSFVSPLFLIRVPSCPSWINNLQFLDSEIMLPLLNAIYSFFTSGGLISSFPGGYHRDQAPSGTAMPYVVSKVVSSQTEFAYGGATRSVTQISFNAYGVGHDAIGALAELLVSHFDGTLLSLSSGTNDTVLRKGEPAPTLHSQDAQGNDVWEWTVTYEYGVVEQ